MPKNINELAEVAVETSTEDPQTREQQWLPITSLRVDPTYQRDLDMVRVRKMAKSFDPDAIGTIEVSRRSDGFYVLDGQHRIALMFEIGWQDQTLPCLIHHGLSVQDEARIYRLRNFNTVKPNALALYRAGLVEGDPEATGIETVVKRNGLQISASAGNGSILAVAAMRRIYRHAGSRQLDETLSLIVQLWGKDTSNFQADFTVGLALFLKRNSATVSRDVLKRQLAKTTPQAILLKAAAAKAMGSGRYWATAIPDILTEIYNKSLRSGRLSSWERRPNVRDLWK